MNPAILPSAMYVVQTGLFILPMATDVEKEKLKI